MINTQCRVMTALNALKIIYAMAAKIEKEISKRSFGYEADFSEI